MGAYNSCLTAETENTTQFSAKFNESCKKKKLTTLALNKTYHFILISAFILLFYSLTYQTPRLYLLAKHYRHMDRILIMYVLFPPPFFFKTKAFYF